MEKHIVIETPMYEKPYDSEKVKEAIKNGYVVTEIYTNVMTMKNCVCMEKKDGKV